MPRSVVNGARLRGLASAIVIPVCPFCASTHHGGVPARQLSSFFSPFPLIWPEDKASKEEERFLSEAGERF